MTSKKHNFHDINILIIVLGGHHCALWWKHGTTHRRLGILTVSRAFFALASDVVVGITRAVVITLLLILSHTIAFILASFPAVVVCRSVIHTHSRTHFICWYYHPLPLPLISRNSFGFKWKLYIFLFNLLVFIKSKCDCCLLICSLWLSSIRARPTD